MRIRIVALSLSALALTAASDHPAIAPDIAQRVSRFKRVEMPFTYDGLSAREQRLVKELIAASQELEDIYWLQNNPADITLYKSLAGRADESEQLARRYLWINGSRFDQIHENEPFIGTEKQAPGRALYPKGLTRGDLEAYVKAHPAQ